MDRKHVNPRLTPKYTPKRQNSLNSASLTTENSCMPNKNSEIPHRVVLVKADHQWRFEWQTGQEISAVKAITEIAKSSETDFDWFDAAMVCHEMSKITAKAA